MKKYRISFISIFIFFLGILGVKAAPNTITISTNTTRAIVGNNITYTVKVNSGVGLIALQYGITYDQAKLTLISGSVNGVNYYTKSTSSATYTFVFRAKSSGTANFSFSAEGAAFSSNNTVTFPKTSKSISIITQKQLEDSYSKNNNLSALAVTGHTITPAFKTDVTTYNLEVENNIREVTVTGTKADSKSTVSGLGNHSLEEGINKIVVKVTAQNGISKDYVININVKELEPIELTIDGTKYSVVRKEKLLEKPNDLFILSKTKVNDIEVPAFFNETSNVTLIGLNNSENIIKLYQKVDDKYLLYNQIIFPENITVTQELKDIPEGYVKDKIIINNVEYLSYKKDNINLLNLLNLKTGKTNLYKYDKEEETIQIYDFKVEETQKIEKKEKDIYFYIIIVLSTVLFVTYLVIIIKYFQNKFPKREKKIEKSDKINKVINKKEK